MRSHPTLAFVGWLAAAAMAIGGVLVSGVSMSSIPLVGGQVSGPTYELHLLFSNALNLPDRAPVRLNGATVGNVENIATRGYVAVVDVHVRGDVRLPVGTTAQLRRSTPLGDVSVALIEPSERGVAFLRDGDTLDVAKTSTAPQIEDLITSSSLLINGGGLTDIVTIVREMRTLLHGREEVPADLMARLESLLGIANRRSEEIDRILQDTNTVAADLRENRTTLRALLKESPDAAEALSAQTDEFVRLLADLGDLGDESHDLIASGSRDLVPLLTDTTTVLRGFEDIDGDLKPVLTDLLGLVPILRSVTRGEQLSGTANFTVQPSIINGFPTNNELLPGIAAPPATRPGTQSAPPPEAVAPNPGVKVPKPSELVSPIQRLLNGLLGGAR